MKEKSTWEEFFDAHAPVYEDNIFTKNTIREVDFLIEELALPPCGSILDVGCGTGRHSIELARRGYSVTGLDLSGEMLARAAASAEAGGVNVDWIRSDAAHFSLPEKYDGAICLCEGAFGLLGAKDDPIGQTLSILTNISRSLKPGAKALLTVLNGVAIGRGRRLTARRGSKLVSAPFGISETTGRIMVFMPDGLHRSLEMWRSRAFAVPL